MKNPRYSISPIKVIDSFNESTPENKFFSAWKLMSQVLELHNSLNEVRASIVQINKFWKLSQYQLETSIDTIISTFRGLLQSKDKEIRILKDSLQEQESVGQRVDKEIFNKCIRGSILQQIQTDKGTQTIQTNKQGSSSEYLQSLQKEVEIIKSKLAQLDQESSTKLNTIREVTELCTSRDQTEDVGERYEDMLREEGSYDFKEDLEILKNFNMESTKIISTSKDQAATSALNQSNQERKDENGGNKQSPETKQITKRVLEKSNQQNQFITTQPFKNIVDFDNSVQSTIIKVPGQFYIEFPAPPKITLASLSQVKPNLTNQTQQYIGNYWYVGGFDENNERHGYGTLKKNNREIYIGNWRKGQFDGWGKLHLNTSKFIEYSGEFKNGGFDGRGTLLFRNGDKYMGEIVQNKVYGEGTWHRNEGESLCGIWENNTLIKQY